MNAERGADVRIADKGQIAPQVYDTLRDLAGRYMAGERCDHTLQATALVHEVYVKLAQQQRAQWRDEVHFMCVAATAMRRILVDHHRVKQGPRGGGQIHHTTLDGQATIGAEPDMDYEALDHALTKFAQFDADGASIVEMRFFAGMTMDQIASALERPKRTVERHWEDARLWLYNELSKRR